MGSALQSGCAALGEGTRFAIFQALREKPRAVGELAQHFPVSRPAVSQHLKILLDAGLVSVAASGTKRIYTMNDKGFTRLNLWLDQFWRA